MRFLFPRIPRSLLLPMLWMAGAGFGVGAVFGVLHDLVTFQISSEYFTHVKFHQFPHLDFGWGPRMYAMTIGFVASGAMGFISGWFMARTALPKWPFHEAIKRTMRGCIIIMALAVGGGLLGFLLAALFQPGLGMWQELCMELGIQDVRSFVRVVYIHHGTYIGAFGGLIAVIIQLRRNPSGRSE